MIRSTLSFLCWWMVFMLSACAMQKKVESVAEQVPEKLIVARTPQSPYLNISVAAFKTDQPGKGGLSRIYAPIREVEAGYFPVKLRDTLIDAGHWGAVRVSPEASPSAEIDVTAHILVSTAVELKLQVQVKDSRGAIWENKVYDYYARPDSYAAVDAAHNDAFQPLFNQIANDIYRARAKLSADDTKNIVRASVLRYAVSLSPQAFSQYLSEDEQGVLKIVGLPAENDKMYARVRKIREAEYTFEDVMDDQYTAFYKRLQNVYPYWQQYSYELLAYNHEINQAGTVSGERRTPGTWAATEDVYKTYKEYKENEDALRELADSFKSETHRTVSRLEGRVIELTGPLADQYAQWRELLKKIYTQERGTGSE